MARLKLRDDEVERYTHDLGRVIGFFQVLSQVDVSQLEPLGHSSELRNVVRPDEPQVSLEPDTALENAPRRRDDFFLVPPVLPRHHT